MNNKRYQHILFDLDGTLTDPMIGITCSVKYALSYFNIEVEDLRSLCPFIGPPLKTSFKDFYQFTDEQADVAIAKYREYFQNKVFSRIPCIKVLMNYSVCLPKTK